MLDAQNDVARAVGRSKAHRRGDRFRSAATRSTRASFLRAILGLRVLLPVVIPANEIFGLGDHLLLLFERARLHLESLGLLPPIGREVARIVIDGRRETVRQVRSVTLSRK